MLYWILPALRLYPVRPNRSVQGHLISSKKTDVTL